MGALNWLKHLVSSDSRKPSPPEGRRVFAVGDVHGRLDLLDALLEKIKAYPRSASDKDVIVFLGDYIDRGAHSKGVIDRLLTLDLPGWDKVFVRGNHDQAILDFLRDPMSYRAWRSYGAPETLLSYGVTPPRFDSEEDILRARDALEKSLPEKHLSFFHGLEYKHEEGDYLFVHAGVRPGIRIEDQMAEDLMWIRDDFLHSNRDFGKVVVHGHTPTEKPVQRSNRIGLDTGAYVTGCLTAAVFEGETCKFLSVQPVEAVPVGH
jgi:serine/threonine protein phosphatase 1